MGPGVLPPVQFAGDAVTIGCGCGCSRPPLLRRLDVPHEPEGADIDRRGDPHAPGRTVRRRSYHHREGEA